MILCHRKLFLLLFFLVARFTTLAQLCPVNIGVEDGSFTNWKCFHGTVDEKNGINVTFSPVPLTDVHTIWKNTSPQIIDPYGGFPVNCPNGSKYSIQLGNSSGGAEAERISYTYTIPADKQNYSIIYYYAIVLQSGGHLITQQPGFQTAVKDVTSAAVLAALPVKADPSGLTCSTHSFSPLTGATGFNVSAIDRDVFYKEWSPAIINLDGYAGHTIEISFTTNDCTPGSHFGYAYIDLNEICDATYEDLITGNTFCSGSQSMTLVAPTGFMTYRWFDEAKTKRLGTESSLTLNTIPPIGTKYALDVTPYPGQGCTTTIYTEIKSSAEQFNLKVQSTISNCKASGVDLTPDGIKAGSSSGLKYEYYTDAAGHNVVPNPKLITTAGTYYIKGSNVAGCTGMQPIEVRLSDGPLINVNTPALVCYPATVDLEKAFTTSDPGVSFIYYTDPATETPIADYHTISTSGTYYAKATSTVPGLNCSASVKSVDIVVSPLPPVITDDSFSGCSPVNLNTYTRPGPESTLKYQFFTDAQGMQPVPDPANITAGGAYYFKALNDAGCESHIAQLLVTVWPPAIFNVTDPAPVVKPEVVNLADTYLPVAGLTFTYWQDIAATQPLSNYQSVGQSGTYYIKAVNGNNCWVINPVHVVVNEPPGVNMVFKNTFSPNGDGVNDKFTFTVTGTAQVNYLKIYNRYGQRIFETAETDIQWDGTNNGKPLPAGTYYWVFSCYDTYYKKAVTKSGSVTIIR